MTTVYAARDGAIIWSNGNKVHKQGRVNYGEPLVIIKEMYVNWYTIERPINLYIGDDPSPVPDPAYEEYWVWRSDTIDTLDPTPDPEPQPEPEPDPDTNPDTVSDEDAASAILVLLRWWRQGLVFVSFSESSE